MMVDLEQQPSSASSDAMGAQETKKGTTSEAATETIAPKLPASGDPRTHAAWRTWLAALAEDAEAALAAAVTYEGLTDEDRVRWLDALEADAPDVHVPRIALYAPLLGVESDDARRERILIAMTVSAGESDFSQKAPRAFMGASMGERTCVLVLPLYLEFVELLVCRYGKDGIASAHHEPLLSARDVPKHVAKLNAHLEEVDLEDTVESLAHAVVADRRAGRAPNPDVVRFSRLFDTARR